MTEEAEHAKVVDEWMERSCRGLPAPELVSTFDRAFKAIWGRARKTLGEITLIAIVDRVLHTTADRFPTFGSLAIEDEGLRCEALLAAGEPLGAAELYGAFRLVLVEFLTVLGNLTADILTPALHAQLSAVEGPQS